MSKLDDPLLATHQAKDSLEDSLSSVFSTPPGVRAEGLARPDLTSEGTFDAERAWVPDETSRLTFEQLPVRPDLVCFSHLRWDFVFQRPQHLFTRFAAQTRVFFVEEPFFDATENDYLEVRTRGERLWVITPHFPNNRSAEEDEAAQKRLIKEFIVNQRIDNFVAWYYTPTALGYSADLQPVLTVYDCMDELSAFAGAPPHLLERERELFRRADLVFTGGQSLYEAKRDRHPRVYAFPSSIDRVHFGQARTDLPEPADQVGIPAPRLGFFGVIDERMDVQLVGELARLKPEWQIILLGPVVKIDPNGLPRLPNIHYLGMKSYPELPGYISHWQVALLPFALNESTRFISPTKTPEYLAAGKPVVSTPITDVVRPYGELQLVHIAQTPSEFAEAIEKSLQQHKDPGWLDRVDAYLSHLSWDRTWADMTHLMCQQLLPRKRQ
ncbi:MAG: glycosyltransferase family 1 protein [Ferruginibacter sp.]|nr:glycosyltransferase family 1 protein [Cytophagales bacterium]